MNWIVLIAGLLSLVGLIGHLSLDRKKFLLPMLEASVDPLAKTVLHGYYHFFSASACLSTIMILLLGLNIWRGFTAVLYFIAANLLLGAVVQFIIAMTSTVSWGIFKIRSWIGFVVVAILLFVGG